MMVEFPSEEVIKWWAEYIPDSKNLNLIKYLPKIDNQWKSRINSVISQIEMNCRNGYLPDNVHYVGSFIFYKINKAHNEIDGNKRTAIIITYLFFLMNDFALLGSNELRLLAKRVAKSKGKKNQEKWILKINDFLVKNTVSLKN